jgi:tRNA U34 5-methylaminomethyl-2-thiouridine-forming methyltransferase MnmC
MKFIKTDDGSYAAYSEEYNELYKSNTGAAEEALKKFVEPCQIQENMSILDIGFGLGYNIAAAMQNAKHLKIVSLEKNLVDINLLEVPDSLKHSYEKIKKCTKDLHYKDEYVEITIIQGDAVQTIKKINEKFDAVFLDPFSPSKNPELWTADFFKDIKERMKKNARLATYSCAGIVRRNLKEAGFAVKDGPRVGRRSPSTIAVNV